MTNPDIDLQHSALVRRLAKPGEDIIRDLTPEKAHLLHMAVLVCGEAGELADALKRYVIYGKPLDLANVIEELGDLEFALRGIRDPLCISRAESLQRNVSKLEARYPKGYSNAAAQARADKAVFPPGTYPASLDLDSIVDDKTDPNPQPLTPGQQGILDSIPQRNHPFVTPHRNRDGDEII